MYARTRKGPLRTSAEWSPGRGSVYSIKPSLSAIAEATILTCARTQEGDEGGGFPR